MPNPLTHHEILGLVEPFTRRGRQVDLGATNRLERRLVFKPVDYAGEAPALTGAREVLQLENPHSGLFRLTRTLTLPCGLEATLQTEGAQPAELLARIEGVPPERHFRPANGVVIAQSYRLNPSSGSRADGAMPIQMVLTRGTARIDGLNLTLNAPTVKRFPADIELVPAAGDSLELPDDLLAVLGWDWGRLRPGWAAGKWSSYMRVRGREPERTRMMEAKLEKTVAHLAQTLAEPPRLFHERLARARWSAAFRRAIPLLFVIFMVAGAVGLNFVEIPEGSIIRLLIFNAPPLLLVIPFLMYDVPRLELPPLPRPSAAPAWRQTPPASSGAAAAPQANP